MVLVLAAAPPLLVEALAVLAAAPPSLLPGVSLDGKGDDVTEPLLAFMPCEIPAIEVVEVAFVSTPPGDADMRESFGVSKPLKRGLAAAVRGCVADSDSCW